MKCVVITITKDGFVGDIFGPFDSFVKAHYYMTENKLEKADVYYLKEPMK